MVGDGWCNQTRLIVVRGLRRTLLNDVLVLV